MLKPAHQTLTGIVIAMVAGCSGKIVNYPLTNGFDDISKTTPLNGVVHYNKMIAKETVQFTQIMSNGKPSHHYLAERKIGDLKPCRPQSFDRIVIKPNYSDPWVIQYDPGFLEKYNFKVDFENGAIKSLNTESSPDRGETFKNVTEGVKNAASIFTLTDMTYEPDDPKCDATPIIISVGPAN